MFKYSVLNFFAGIFILSGCMESSFAQQKQITLNIESASYSIVSPKSDFSVQTIHKFHQQFTNEEKKTFEIFNIKKPDHQTIIIAGNSIAFSKITSQNWHTASLYDPSSGKIYFQNPLSLEKNNILIKSIKHELCHQSAFILRNKTSTHFEMEECICEAYSGTYIYGKTLPAGINQYGELLQYLSRDLRSRNHKKILTAYKTAASFGSYIIQKMGPEKALEIAAFQEKNKDLLSRLFESYRSSR